MAMEHQAEDEPDHRSGDHGAEGTAANRATQSPAERHRNGTENAPKPERACRHRDETSEGPAGDRILTIRACAS